MRRSANEELERRARTAQCRWLGATGRLREWLVVAEMTSRRMSRWEFVRLRGTIVAISTFFTIVALYVVIDQVPPPSVESAPQQQSAGLSRAVVSTTIPIDNRLCGLAQRVLDALPQDEPGVVRAMADFFTEAATFTDGDLHGDFVAASRYYREVNDIARKADWDIDRIVRNNDGPRWRALLTGIPTGVEESRNDLRVTCRANLPPPPSIEVDRSGRILDPELAKLLAPPDKEIHRPPPEPEAEPDTTATTAN